MLDLNVGRLPCFVHKGKKTAIVPALVSSMGFCLPLHLCTYATSNISQHSGKKRKTFTRRPVLETEKEEVIVSVLTVSA